MLLAADESGFDWSKILSTAESVLTKAVLPYQTTRLQAEAAARIAESNARASAFTGNPYYSAQWDTMPGQLPNIPDISTLPQIPQKSALESLMPVLLIGGVGIAAFLLLSDRE